MGAEQKVAIITRAEEGIGPALVAGFLSRNYRVVAVLGVMKPCFMTDLFAVTGNISEERTAERVIAEAMARFGRIDTLVNNVAVPSSKEFAQYSPDDWHRMTRTTLDTFFPVTRQAVEVMGRKSCGHVLNIAASTDATQRAHPAPFLVAAANGFFCAATQSLAVELAPRHVRVNAVVACIGTRRLVPHEEIDCTRTASAGVDPPDAVSAALYLDTAPFVTGEVLQLNGAPCRLADAARTAQTRS